MSILWASPATVYSVVKAAKPGDVVQLASGAYGALNLWAIQQTAPGVTVQPAPGAACSVSAINADQSTWLIIRGFDVAMATTTQYAIATPGASNLTFDGLKVHQADNSTLSGVGAFLRNASNITISNSVFHHLGVGIQALDSSAITLTGNEIHHVMVDGIDLYGTGDSKVLGNHIHDLTPGVGDHPDAIQLAGTADHPTPSGNVITGNTYERGADAAAAAAQGVFVEDQTNLVIKGNALRGPMYNGIGLARVKAAEIAFNFVQGYPDMGTRIIYRGACDSLKIHDNFAQAIVDYAADGVNTNVALTNNTIIPGAASPTDATVYNAWAAGPTAPPVVSLPPPPPPAPPPPPPPVDPRDAQIASLTAQVTALQAKITAAAAALR